MSNDTLFLDRVYHWEKTAGDSLYMTQPMGGGSTRTYTWKQTLDEARRMATYIESLGFEPGSRIAILSKNCAHFVMTDLAIWMAGHVSVALYPTLAADTVSYCLDHSDAKLLFVGKLDTWDEMKEGVPADLPCISYPLSPKTDFPTWDDLIKEHEPKADSPARAADDLAILVYTSGSTGQPKGVMHSFGTMSVAAARFVNMFDMSPSDRMLSYLPLAHVFERVLCGDPGLRCTRGCRSSSPNRSRHVRRRTSTGRSRRSSFRCPRLWLKFQLGVFSEDAGRRSWPR